MTQLPQRACRGAAGRFTPCRPQYLRGAQRRAAKASLAMPTAGGRAALPAGRYTLRPATKRRAAKASLAMPTAGGRAALPAGRYTLRPATKRRAAKASLDADRRRPGGFAGRPLHPPARREAAGRRGSSEGDLPPRLNPAQDLGVGRGLNPAPDERRPATF